MVCPIFPRVPDRTGSGAPSAPRTSSATDIIGRGLIIALKAIAGAVLGLVVLAAVYLLVVMFKG